MRSQEVDYKFCVVGGTESIERGEMYHVELVDNDGGKYGIWAFGINTIMEAPEAVDLAPVRQLFPHAPDSVFSTLPKRDIDILVGLNHFSLHPDGGQGRNCVGNLRLLHSRFSTGWVLGGAHPDLELTSPPFSGSALLHLRCARVEVKPVLNIGCSSNADFMESESLEFCLPSAVIVV